MLPLSHPRGEKSFSCYNTLLVGTSRRLPHSKFNFITNVCKHLRLGRLHLREHHLVLLYLESILFCFVIVLHMIFIFRFCIHLFIFKFCYFLYFGLLFNFQFCSLFSIIVISVLSFYFQFSYKKLKNT